MHLSLTLIESFSNFDLISAIEDFRECYLKEKTTNQGISIARFELVEAGAINNSSDYFTNIERCTIICWDYSHQVLSVVSGCFYRLNVQPLLWLNIEILYNLSLIHN